jgi:hypothetical protein
VIYPGLDLDALATENAGGDQTELLLALIMAADHQRLDVIDRLLDADAPIDATDPHWHRRALRVAAQNGRPRQRPSPARRGRRPGTDRRRGSYRIRSLRA